MAQVVVAFASVGILTACRDANSASMVTGVPPIPVQAEPKPPQNVAIAVGSPVNVLTARVSFVTQGADSIRVAYQATGGPVQYTPYHAAGGADTIVLVGLRPGTGYQYYAEARTGRITEASAPDTFTTAPLPADLAIFQLQQLSGVQHHYAATSVMTSQGGYAVIFDSTGTIVWYHDFTSTGMDVSNVVQQRNGNITAFIGNTSGWQPLPGYYVEMNPASEIVATYTPPDGTYMDDHELLLTGTGEFKRAHYFTFTTQIADLTSIGMGPEMSTAGHQLRRQSADGALEFMWDAWSKIGFDEWVGDSLAKANRTVDTDFDHPNSLTFDRGGNYVASWRNLDQVTAIDPNTGAILWRLGGKKSDFRFVNDPLGGFHKQHSVKILTNGDVLLFDNGTEHTPAQSRAVEYKLDFAAKTATMVWESRHTPAIYAQYVGWVDRFTNGNTWVAYSFVGRVSEVDASGNVVSELQLAGNGTPLGVYRIVPVSSLYVYVRP